MSRPKTRVQLTTMLRPWLSSRRRSHRILSGPLRGSRIVTSWHDYPAGIVGITERPLLAWLAKHVGRGETWLDVGAHYGYTAIALSRLVTSTGRVFAFEPMSATADCLVQMRGLNALAHLTVVPQGLGAPESVETLHLPCTRGMADLTIAASETSTTISVARFDWLWPQIS